MAARGFQYSIHGGAKRALKGAPKGSHEEHQKGVQGVRQKTSNRAPKGAQRGAKRASRGAPKG